MLSGKADPGSVLSSVASVPLSFICPEARLLGSVRSEFTLQQASRRGRRKKQVTFVREFTWKRVRSAAKNDGNTR